MICTYLYVCVLLLVFSVICMHQGARVTQFQFSVCVYGTCGRIDNKADLTLRKCENSASDFGLCVIILTPNTF